MKFEDAYCTITCQVHSIEEITDIYTNDINLFLNKFKNYLVCPECHQASLSYNSAGTPYFKSFPRAVHDENCSLRQKEMPLEQIRDYVANRNNVDAIHRQLNGLLLLLLSADVTKISSGNIMPKSTNSIDKITNNYRIFSERLPRKRIDLPFQKEDLGAIKLFYGNVHLKWEKEDGKNKYKILLYHLKTSKLLCKLFLTDAVYQHLKSEYRQETPCKCAIAFLANFEFDTGKTYQSTNLQHSTHLVLSRLT